MNAVSDQLVRPNGKFATKPSFAVYDSDSYSEVSPGHWRIEAQGVYESQRFPLTYDLYVEGDTMRGKRCSPATFHEWR